MPMTKDQIRAMKFAGPGLIPVEVYCLPAAWTHYRGDLDAVFKRHLDLLPNYKTPDYDNMALSPRYHTGHVTDEWGCVWSNAQDGMDAIVTGHPVKTREAAGQLKAPSPMGPWSWHSFMYLRLGDLRGFEELMLDFAEDAPELQHMIDVVRDYGLAQMSKMMQTLPPGDIVRLGDDLGMQTGLAVGPEKWRQYLKPCYEKFFGTIHAAGRPGYFHTDGCIWEIIPDLIECGVDVINPQFRPNGMEHLVEVCRGKVCTDLDIDRQMMPFCSPKDMDDHVKECVMKMGSREGGLWLKGEIGKDVPLEIVEALLSALEKYRTYWS